MPLTIRVMFAVLFGAFALWGQTPDSNTSATVPAAAESGLLNRDVSPATENRPFVFTMNRFEYKPYSGLEAQASAPQLPPSRPKAISYSHGYETRQKIHKYASIATLPLFISEAVVGQKLFDRTANESDSLRGAHSALAAGIGVLFGVNSVTGVWNMWEARKDPNGRRKRLFHGITMLAADAGFVATAALAPHREDNLGVRKVGDASTHRAVAYASFGVATVSYVYMFIAR
jgi:hypothetical protein